MSRVSDELHATAKLCREAQDRTTLQYLKPNLRHRSRKDRCTSRHKEKSNSIGIGLIDKHARVCSELGTWLATTVGDKGEPSNMIDYNLCIDKYATLSRRTKAEMQFECLSC